jgi:hypothetical protein
MLRFISWSAFVRTQSVDTNPEVERVQIEHLRNLAVHERLKLGDKWSKAVMQMTWAALRRANPDVAENELDLIFVETLYGKTLAGRLRAYLQGRAGRE